MLFNVSNNDKRNFVQVVIIAETVQKYEPSCVIRDVETVFVQGDARIARHGFSEQCNLFGAVQISHFHSLIFCRHRCPVHPLLCVKKQWKVSKVYVKICKLFSVIFVRRCNMDCDYTAVTAYLHLDDDDDDDDDNE